MSPSNDTSARPLPAPTAPRLIWNSLEILQPSAVRMEFSISCQMFDFEIVLKALACTDEYDPVGAEPVVDDAEVVEDELEDVFGEAPPITCRSLTPRR